MRPKKRELHELSYTEIVKSETIRLVFRSGKIILISPEHRKKRIETIYLKVNALMDSVPTSVDSYFLELYKKKFLFPSPEINIFFAKFPSYFGYSYPKDFF